MTIQEAINTAHEGGYHMYGSDGMETSYDGANNDNARRGREKIICPRSLSVGMEKFLKVRHYTLLHNDL